MKTQTQMGIYIDIQNASVDLVCKLLDLQQTLGNGWKMNLTGGGYFIGFIPSQDWSAVKALLQKEGVYGR